MPETKPPRIAISSAIDDALLCHLPEGVEVVRFGEGDMDIPAVDLLVMPNLGPQARLVLPRIHARYVQSVSAGIEAILPLLPPGVTLCNARGVHDRSTAEWTITAILASFKWLPFYDGLQREGKWGTRAEADAHWSGIYGSTHGLTTPVMLEELADKSVLIVGYGSIGKAIEARLQPFEPARIMRVARTAREGVHAIAELDALLPEADIVVLIAPLTPETRHLIGGEQLRLMRRGALIVNAARGGVVDTDALVEALATRHIRAALDVTDPEPLPAGHPLWKTPNLLLTPHIAGSTPAFLDRVFQFVGVQARHLLAGEEPENIIRGAY